MNVTRTTLPRARALTYVLGGVAITAAVVTVLWWAGTRGLVGSELVTARLDALRVGLSVAVGGGGVFALHLAWRRQRATEAGLALQERVAAATEKDAEIRRVTDQYTKTAELLGSDKATVRLAGIRALADFAQDNPAQRAKVVDVWCGYLRMPFTPGDDAELQVRREAQLLLAHHLRPANPGFWPGMNLHLTGATLVKFDFSGCEVEVAQFHAATFVGPAAFRGATFGRSAGFGRATFTDDVDFAGVTFRGNAVFRVTTFTRQASFEGATCLAKANFESASFAQNT